MYNMFCVRVLLYRSLYTFKRRMYKNRALSTNCTVSYHSQNITVHIKRITKKVLYDRFVLSLVFKENDNYFKKSVSYTLQQLKLNYKC